jgi:hypothetical protein
MLKMSALAERSALAPGRSSTTGARACSAARAHVAQTWQLEDRIRDRDRARRRTLTAAQARQCFGVPRNMLDPLPSLTCCRDEPRLRRR